ncbi:MAG: nucleotidyltransferase family protein [Methanobrevibacter sp.]|nr:nucleotidyltransferase family protein [Candidatus Methanoflexus mossambicus]
MIILSKIYYILNNKFIFMEIAIDSNKDRFLNDFVKNILENDRKTFFNDFNLSQSENLLKNDLSIELNDLEYLNPLNFKNINEIRNNSNKTHRPIIADFTEYNPLHNGHYHCMQAAKKKVPNGIFVAIVPGLFERSGRGVPFILHRNIRAKIAISLGADIVVEGPPMGIMGSGQYSLCLCKMFKTLKTDFIPRGYRPFDGYDEILGRIAMGHGVAPKPYKLVDMDTKEVVYRGKLEEDNYVIASFSKVLKKIGFDFKNKFIFVKRIEGVSGTLIRRAVETDDFDGVKSMLPQETIAILKEEINNNRAPLHNIRNSDVILKNVNTLDFNELRNLNLFNDTLTQNIIDFRKNKEFKSIDEILNIIPYGFSTHYKSRILSILEANINKEIIHKYINEYPFIIRILDYKNNNVLKEFKDYLGINY